MELIQDKYMRNFFLNEVYLTWNEQVDLNWWLIYLIIMFEQRWNLKNLSRGLNPPKPSLIEAPA